MAFSQRLEIRQGQSLVMTPQLQQAIKLLQLSNMELDAFCEQELEKNPLLERGAEPSALDERPAPDASPELPDQPLENALEREDFSKSEDMDAAQEDMYEPSEGDGPSAASLSDWGKGGGQGGSNEDFLESAVSESVTLKDHLREQLAIAMLNDVQRLICLAMIDSVDEAGYLRMDLMELAGKLEAPLEEILAVLSVLQGFDPVGVGARDLAECLSLQLKEKNHFDPAMEAMLSRLDLIARHDVAQLTELCGVDEEDIHDMFVEIRHLNPKPGLSYGSDPVQPVVPDVLVHRGKDGTWQVELNAETLPRLLVNMRYYTKVSTGSQDKKAKAYLSDCLNNAHWLVKSLDQRARTILKVSAEIVRQQEGFLNHGVRHLRPLNLRMIADAIGMHESTVSRVTSNKFMATPRGLFELKYFFTAAIPSVGGAAAHSAEAVRDRIKEMIDGESPKAILSDDKIVAMLTADGVNIARRTVAKYREAMHIPSSVERRRLKADA